MRAAVRLAVLGDMLGADAGKLVAELNLQQTDLVATTGNFLRGFATSGAGYENDANATREALSKLTTMWYPCVGNREAWWGANRKTPAGFYEKYVGPRYYSVDLGDVHVIMLDTEENPQSVIFSEPQLLWLAKDLDKAFRRARHVVVVMHRPAWRDEKSNWPKLHKMLAEFGRRPVVAIEGQPNFDVRGGKVEAVFAAGGEYCEDDAREGIRLITAGAAKGSGSAATGRMSQYLVARVGEGGLSVSVVEPGNVRGADLLGTTQREAIAKLEADGVFAVEGTVDEPAGKESGTLRAAEGSVWLAMTNPLDVPIHVRAKLMPDSDWRISGANQPMVLKPGENLRVRIGLYSPARETNAAAPEIIFTSTFESTGTRELELRRPVMMAPSAGAK
jgi:hypothetical protein